MTKIVVAMSGGVDSSVTAALLLKQGYEVMGLNMRLWQDERLKANHQAEIDAAKVCSILGIEHKVMDYTKFFRETVVENFLTEYALGHTPNPCVYCNKKLKFGVLYEAAMKEGGDYLSTGHYVRLTQKDGFHYIQKAAYLAKDQSYVLYHLNQEILSHVVFPLGDYDKPQIRKLAEEMQLPVFAKKDSQEICFIPDNDHHSFLATYGSKKERSGNFVTTKGQILGVHKGLSHYTVGQRKGLGIASTEPFFVLALDSQTNTVVLGYSEEAACQGLKAVDVVFADGKKRCESFSCEVKIRYNAKPQSAKVLPGEDGEVAVLFTEPLRGIAPGQAVVFYQGDICIGGGTIMESIH